MDKNIEIFISYAHKDEDLQRKLEKHIALLHQQGLITTWHNRDINAGSEWAAEIDAHLHTSQIILLLISASFLASQYCYSKEMMHALERHESGDACVIPIIIRPVDWKGAPFSKLQVLPVGAKPVTGRGWHNLDEAFADVAQGVREAVETLTAEKSWSLSTLSTPVASRIIVPTQLPRPATLVGRDAELNKLMARLRAGETSGIYALNGMGGVGKTALAAEVVWRLFQEHGTFPGGAAWIFCEGLEGPTGLLAVWRQVALALKLEQVAKISDSDQQRRALTNALLRFPRLLLVLDNIEPKLNANILLDTLIVHDHTSLLLTTRQVLLPEKLTSIMLYPLLVSSASQLFIQRLQQIDDTRPTKNDELWISEIMSALGRLPLAIELVAAYAGVQRLPLDHILEELKQDKLDATSLNFDSDRAVRSRFNRSWTILSSLEQYLFASLSQLRGIIFPRQSAVVLAQSIEASSPNLPKTSIASAKEKVARLVAYSLIEPVGRSYLRLHPLLREYASEQFYQIKKRVEQRREQWREQDEREHQGVLVEQSLKQDPEDEIYSSLINYVQQENDKVQDYPNSYDGLSGSEAQNVWELHQDAYKNRWKYMMDGRSSYGDLPITRDHIRHHALELLKLGVYVREMGDQIYARKYITESLFYSEAAEYSPTSKYSQTMESANIIGLCHWYLALLDEHEGNYGNAAEHYSEVLRLFELDQQRNAKQMHSALESIRSKIEQCSVTSCQKELRGFISIESIKGQISVYEIHNKPLYIGRSPEADICLNHSFVSRKHLILLPLDKYGCDLKDEGSTNGTWLNDLLMNKYQAYPLQPGDSVRIGKIILVFTMLDHSLLYFLERNGFHLNWLASDKQFKTMRDFFVQIFSKIEDY